MSLGIDGTVIVNRVDFFTFCSDLGDGIGFLGLQLLNELVYDIDEDDLDEGASLEPVQAPQGQDLHLKASQAKLFSYKATANIATSEVNSFETHCEGGVACCVESIGRGQRIC